MEPDQYQSRVLDSLSFYPRVKLDLQFEDEKVILLIREHPITQLPWIFNCTVLSLILILLNFFFPQFLNPFQILFVNIFAGTLIFAFGWLNFIKWYFEVGVVTDKRILDVDFKSILYKEVSLAKLANIEEISSQSSGYIGTLFNFGNVYVQTAGADIDIEFRNTPDPAMVVKLINKLTHE